MTTCTIGLGNNGKALKTRRLFCFLSDSSILYPFLPSFPSLFPSHHSFGSLQLEEGEGEEEEEEEDSFLSGSLEAMINLME